MAKKEDLNFEETMQNLEDIVEVLEKGELNLDDLIKKFEEGIELSKKANSFLENAEKKITLLITKDDGNIEEEEF